MPSASPTRKKTGVQPGAGSLHETDAAAETERVQDFPELRRTFCAQQMRLALIWSGVPSPHASGGAERQDGDENNASAHAHESRQSAQVRRERGAIPPLDDEIMEHSWQPVIILPSSLSKLSLDSWFEYCGRFCLLWIQTGKDEQLKCYVTHRPFLPMLRFRVFEPHISPSDASPSDFSPSGSVMTGAGTGSKGQKRRRLFRAWQTERASPDLGTASLKSFSGFDVSRDSAVRDSLDAKREPDYSSSIDVESGTVSEQLDECRQTSPFANVTDLLRHESDPAFSPPPNHETLAEPENNAALPADWSEAVGEVPLMNPRKMRLALEMALLSGGEDILYRDVLRKRHPTLFWNLAWSVTSNIAYLFTYSRPSQLAVLPIMFTSWPCDV